MWNELRMANLALKIFFLNFCELSIAFNFKIDHNLDNSIWKRMINRNKQNHKKLRKMFCEPFQFLRANGT